MDRRRLSTADVLAMGIIEQPPPKTDIPQGRNRIQYDIYEPMSAAQLIKLLEDEANCIDCSEYYGIPHIWKEGEGSYRGVLLQYRNVTEAPTFTDAHDAVAWFITTAAEVAG
jgi:hypothetical protein